MKWKLFKIILSIIILGSISYLVLINTNYNFKNFEINLPINIKASEKEEDFKKEYELSMVMIGDALFHSAVYGDAMSNNGIDFSKMYTEVKDIFKGYDLAFYNQESILGGTEIGLSTYPRFNSPYEAGDAFLDMGFNIVSLANNHTLDRGEQAIINSRKYWNSKDVLVSGSATSFEERDNIQIKEKNNIKYTMLAYTDTTNGLSTGKGKEYLVNTFNEEQVKKDIESVRDKVDVLMVSMHFGIEYSHEVSERQKYIANYLKDLGVDIIIGHHPHVVERMEFEDNKLVIYSLGNFISAQRGAEKLTGLVAGINIKKTVIGDKSTITLENPTAELVYTASSYASNGGRYNFKVYPYSKLNNNILNNYQGYYDRFMNIVTNGNENIEKR